MVPARSLVRLVGRPEQLAAFPTPRFRNLLALRGVISTVVSDEEPLESAPSATPVPASVATTSAVRRRCSSRGREWTSTPVLIDGLTLVDPSTAASPVAPRRSLTQCGPPGDGIFRRWRRLVSSLPVYHGGCERHSRRAVWSVLAVQTLLRPGSPRTADDPTQVYYTRHAAVRVVGLPVPDPCT